MTTIEITPLNKNMKTLASYAEGEAYRKKFNLDELDKSGDLVYVDISTKFHSVSYKFFVGMFRGSLETLGNKFSSRYRFMAGNKINAKFSEYTTQFMIREQVREQE